MPVEMPRVFTNFNTTKNLFVVVQWGEQPPLQDFLVIVRETERNRQHGLGEKHVSYRLELILRAQRRGLGSQSLQALLLLGALSADPREQYKYGHYL